MHQLQSPPNFLHASDLQSHVKPVAIVPDPEPEASTPAEEVANDRLIDTSSEISVSTSYIKSSVSTIWICIKTCNEIKDICFFVLFTALLLHELDELTR